jgi:hypothetical protein
MGRRDVARGGTGGGERIPAARQIGARLATALFPLGLLGGIVAYSTAAGGRAPEVVAGVGAGGWALTALALAARWPALLPFGLAGVGAGYTVFLSLREQTVDSRAPLVAAAFFAAAELSYWSLERVEGRRDRWLLVRRLLLLGAAALGVALVGALLLVLTSGVSGGVALEAFGVVAAVITAATIARLAARAKGYTST